MQIIVDGLLVRYEISGKGKLVLLLHGWGDDSHTFAKLRSVLDGEYQTLVLDLPGFGGSQAPTSVWDLDDYAVILQKILEKLDLTELYAVIGHSNGGAIAIRAVVLNVLAPQRLILLASAGIRDRLTTHRLLFKSAAKIGKVTTAWMPENQKKSLRKKLYGAAGSDMLLVPTLEGTFKKIVNHDVQSDAAKITIPTLLIFAQNDTAVPLVNGKKLNQLIHGSRLEILSDSGHFVHLDQPEKVESLVVEFLR